MNYTKIIKRETKLMVVIITLLVVIITGASYAMFMRVNSSENDQVVTTGDLRISYSSTNGYINGNTYRELIPLSNTEGLGQTGYSFSVQNTGSLAMTYSVYLYVDSASYATDNPSGALFEDLDSIKFNLETNNSSTNNISKISYQYKKTEDGIDKYEIYTGTLSTTNAKDDHVLKIWLDDTLDVANIGKYVYLKLEVSGNVTGQTQATNTYKVSFDAAGGDVTVNRKTVVLNEAYGNLPIPTREGYTFLGWANDAVDPNTMITDISIVSSAADHTLTAKWQAN